MNISHYFWEIPVLVGNCEHTKGCLSARPKDPASLNLNSAWFLCKSLKSSPARMDKY